MLLYYSLYTSPIRIIDLIAETVSILLLLILSFFIIYECQL